MYPSPTFRYILAVTKSLPETIRISLLAYCNLLCKRNERNEDHPNNVKMFRRFVNHRRVADIIIPIWEFRNVVPSHSHDKFRASWEFWLKRRCWNGEKIDLLIPSSRVLFSWFLWPSDSGRQQKQLWKEVRMDEKEREKGENKPKLTEIVTIFPRGVSRAYTVSPSLLDSS